MTDRSGADQQAVLQRHRHQTSHLPDKEGSPNCSVELVGVMRKLLYQHRASLDTAALWIDVKKRWLQLKEETPKGQRYCVYWDDMVTRNEKAKKHAEDEDEKNAQARSAPGAVDYVQLAIQWTQDNGRMVL